MADQGVEGENIHFYSSNYSSLYSDVLFGFHFGARYTKTLTPRLSFVPALLYTTKGQWEKVLVTNSPGADYKERINYIALPLIFTLDLGKKETKGFYLGFGPYVAVAISGKSKEHNDLLGTERNGKVHITSSVDLSEYNGVDVYVKRFDFGFKPSLGYRISDFLFELNYEAGVVNIHPSNRGEIVTILDERWHDMTKKNTVLSLSLTCFFSKNNSSE